jgi:uncharacterized protein (DUF697 family)
MKTAAAAPDGDNGKKNDKPMLLKAIELILAKAENIKEEAQRLHEKYRKRYSRDRTPDEVADLAAAKVISNYSYYSAFSGGATALAGVIPGLGTVIATFGGATADTALCMKFQIEMVMALATIYGHDILHEEERRLCFIIAALGTISGTAKEGAKQVGTKAFIAMARQYLKGATLTAVKELFKRIGITFTRKALEKSAPFGVGVVISFSANKGLTWYVGTKARDFFKTN